MTAHSPSTHDTRWLALVVLCAGMLMIVLDATVVNVALPSIQNDLGFSQSGLAWVVNAYLIAFGGLLLLAGRLGDLISRRGVFLAGLAVFTVASLACGAAQSQTMLVGARFVQGVGGALTSAVILGMIVTMFPEPREQAKAIGVYGFVASAGGSIGLLLGGVITQIISWHWIFFVNLPIGIVTAIAATRLLAADRGTGWRAGADVPGAALVTGALMLGVYTIVKPAAELGWGASRTLAYGAAAVALLIAFIVREATARNPLMPLRIFRSRTVTGANLVQALSVAGMFGTFFLGALYLQRVLGYDALQTGLAFLPTTLVMGTLSLRYSEALMMRFGAHRLLVPGPRPDRRRAGAVRPRPGARQLRDRHPARARADRRRRRGLLPRADDAGHVRRHAARTPAWPPAWSTRPCRSAARWAWRCWPPPRRAARIPWAAATPLWSAGSTWRSRWPPGWPWPPSWSRWPCCARSPRASASPLPPAFPRPPSGQPAASSSPRRSGRRRGERV